MTCSILQLSYLIESVLIHIASEQTDRVPPIGKIAAHSAYDMFHGIST